MGNIISAGGEFVSNLPKELVNAVGKYVERETEYDDTRVYARKSILFRDIIDSSFPSMLIVDISDIRQELNKYLDISSSIKSDVSTELVPTDKDILKSGKLTKVEIDIIVKAIPVALKIIPSTPITKELLSKELNRIYSHGKIDGDTLRLFKSRFSSTYSIIEGNKTILLFPTFNIAVNTINKYLDIALSTVHSSIESVGDILNLGHSAAGYNSNLFINTPKLMAIAIDIINSSSKTADLELTQATTQFINTTKQIDTYIEVSQDFSENVLSVFVKIGGGILKFENAIINQRKGSVLETKEKRGLNKVVLRKLAEAIKQTSTPLGNKISRLLTIGRSSPSLKDYIVSVVANTMMGTSTPKFTKTTRKDSSTKINTKIPVIVGLHKNRVTVTSKSKISSLVDKTRISSINLLAILQAGINKQVAKNMGQGNEHRVLNYRTGRFAESVQVQRLSESRQGMITAFYSYMRNPYGTFSEGGRQQFPKSRDPKLLISKSVRELAAPIVGARMRAVLV